MAKMFPPVRLPPRAFRAVLLCAYAALHRVMSYAMTYLYLYCIYLYPHDDMMALNASKSGFIAKEYVTW